MSRFKYQILTRYTEACWISTVYENGVCVNSNTPTYFLTPSVKPTAWNSYYDPLRKIVLISKYGLSGGGNYSSSALIPARSNSEINNIVEKSHIIDSTKDLSLNLKQFNNPSVVMTDERRENSLKKQLVNIKNHIKSGIEFSHLIKQIEEVNISFRLNYYVLCNCVLEVLTEPEFYLKKTWAFHREKLSRIARRFFTFHIAFADEHFVFGAYEAAKNYISKIFKCIEEKIGDFPEVGFQLNIYCLDLLVESLKKEEIRENPSAKYLSKVINDFNDRRDSERSVTRYIKVSVKNSRNLACDLILLEFLGIHNNKSSVIKSLLDVSCNLSWQHICIILDHIQTSFKPVDAVQLLSEYLYFSSFEPEIWKVQSRVIELLTQISALHTSFSNLTNIVISEKANIQCENSIRIQLAYINLYKSSLSDYFTNASYKSDLDHPHGIPSIYKFSQVGREYEDLCILFSTQPHKILCITGSAGSGKTSLAVTYCKKRKASYKLILFAKASNKTLLENSFIKFSKRLKLIEAESIDEIIDSVVKHLERFNEKFLLIFDDVNDYELIKNYIPNQGHILITSTQSISGLRYELTSPTEEVIRKYLDKTPNFKEISEKSDNNWHIATIYKKSSTKGRSFNPVPEGREIYQRICEEIYKIQGAQKWLECLSLLENFPISIDFAQRLFQIITKGQHPHLNFEYENLIITMNDWGVIYYKKNFRFTFQTYFHNHIKSIILSDQNEYIGKIVELYSLKIFNIYTKDPDVGIYGSLLINSPIFNSHDCCYNIGILHFVRGLYYLYYHKNFPLALDDFNKALGAIGDDRKYAEKIRFLLGKSYLLLDDVEKCIGLLENYNNFASDPELCAYAKIYLIKAYEIIGKGVQIRDIIFNRDAYLCNIQTSEAAYYAIHGICRLFLTEKKLKKLIAPYAKFLHNITPSILLIKTLLHLSLFFAYKERWTTVLAYMNLIAPVFGISQVLQPSTMHSAMESIIQLAEEIKGKIEVLIGQSNYILSFVYVILAKVYATLGQNESRIEYFQAALDIRLKKYGMDNLSVAEVQFEIAKYHGIKLKNTDLARSYLRHAEKTIKNTAGELSIIYARVLEMKGLFCITESNLTEANQLLNQSFSIKQTILEKSPDNEEMCQGYASLGKLHYKSGSITQALHYYTKALEPNHKIYLSSFWAEKAYKIALELKNFKDALEFKSQQIKLLIHIYEPNSGIVFNEYQKAYQLAIEIHSYEQANNIALESLDILRRITDKKVINYSESMYLIKVADSFAKIRKYDEAEYYLKEAVEIARVTYGARNSEYANAKCALGVFYKDMKKYAKAVSEMSSVLELLDKRKKARILTDIGLCYMKKKLIDEAASAFSNALKIYKEENMNLEVGKTYILMSYLYKDNHHFTTKYLKKAIEIYNKVLGSEHSETVNLYTRLNSLKNLNLSSMI
ncbi:hypothetical protein SteCoe_11751 [Stentor coeruleus]|uniref:NB-ARC domain-containing protein n=1 Tax=Stentor coeruleus TaxID=5963 RepID=A0A1R2CCD4_9CILI|nr:hypothetical protein SteCoe_11751 [Stentor coeruleus]